MLTWTSVRAIAAAVALLLPAHLLNAALPTEPEVSGATSLAGKLLIASPQLREPIFNHAVILLARHSREGALGIVINRPIATRPIAELLSALGADANGISGNVPVMLGGPVQPTVGFILHSADYHRPETLDIDGRVALTSAPEALRDIGLGKGPHKSLVAFGYAGWAPSQLEDEISRGAWVTVPEDVRLVFDDDRTKVWSDALALYKPAP